MMHDADVVIVGSGMAGAAVYRSLQGRGLRITVLEAGPAISADHTHLRNLLTYSDSGWRTLLSAMLTAPVRVAGEPVAGMPPPGPSDGVRADQQSDEALPGLGNCSGVGGNALVWSGIVLPPDPADGEISRNEFETASSWLAARTVISSPRQDWLRDAHGLTAVPLAWSPEHGWHGPAQLAGPRFSPLPFHSARRIVHHGSRAIGVEVRRYGAGEDRLIAARHIVVCAGVVSTLRLLWMSGLGHESPGLGQGIAHHPVAVAQVTIPAAVWSQLADQPGIGRPAAVREFPSPAGGHTLIIAEPPWMPETRVDRRATLSVYAYATLDRDENRRLSFVPEQIGPDGLPLPRFSVPRSPAERDSEDRALRQAIAWAKKLGPVLPSGKPRVLPRGADQHLCGGARIGSPGDPLAVADPSGRLRCLENVWVAGAAALSSPVSTHPSQTIVALAARLGRALIASLPDR